jgi:hypothetical protein
MSTRGLALVRVICFVALAALGGACAKSAGPKYGIYVPGDASTSGLSDVSPGTPNGTVLVVIHSPAANALLSTEISADVSARVSIDQGTDLIDPSSVRVSLTAADNTNPSSTAPLVGPAGDMEYRGKLALAGLKAGLYTITVSARSNTGLEGSAAVPVQLDSGPQLTVLSPIPGAHYKSSLFVQLAADAGAFPPLAELQASIAGTPLMLAATGSPNQYRAVVDLANPITLTGEQLFVVSAKNKNGARTEIRFTFVVDVDGPEVTDTTPVPGEIVGGIVKLEAHVADGAGLNPSSLEVLVGDKASPQFKLALSPDADGGYSVLFDTKNLTGCKQPPATSLCIVHPTLSFRAADLLGNETTISYEIAVDNVPPVADLVPPLMRVAKHDGGFVCSHAFDPLSRDIFSGDMPNDGCRVPQAFDLRARIQDDSNRAAGLKLGPISTVDPEATAVYVLDDVSQPLVVDTDGDTICDAINPKLVPTTGPLTGPRQVLKIRLKPVLPAGTGDYRPDPTVPAICLEGRALDAPAEICRIEQPTVAISYAGGLSAVWAIEPIAPADPRYCFGGQFDTLANNVRNSADVKDGSGWKCIAVATADLNGNVSTSAPIRVWVDYTYGGASGFCLPPPATAGAMPACTGLYNRTTDTVTAGACSARNFLPNNPPEICLDNDCSGPD